MKRSAVDLATLADWHNLASAFGRASAACGDTRAVERYRSALPQNLAELGREILEERVPVGEMTSFRIRDPKPRIIHAPCFRERVLHHALIAHVGPVLDRALVDDTYACRKGKGGLAAVRRCQQHLQRFAWFVQIDIEGFFASIDQSVLLQLLHRKFKHPGLLRLIGDIIQAYQASPGRGLPIGALTSQHFANYYLAGLDRWLLQQPTVRGMVRYMDDLFWCVDNKAEARETLRNAIAFTEDKLKLRVKQPPRIGPCHQGTLFCGYRVLPGRLLLSRRRKRRYIERRRYWEHAYAQGRVDARTLQAGYAAVLGITTHADAATWRREQLSRHPLAKTLEEV
jgi:hypothetical protein